MSSIITLDSQSVAGPLTGRALMLNTTKAPRFQCYGFSVSRNNPIQTVPEFAQELPLRTALADGRLIDITGREDVGTTTKFITEIEKAVKQGNLTKVEDGEEVGPPLLVGKDSKGNAYFIIPKDYADYARMQAEIEATGSLRVEKPKSSHYTGLSSIYEEPLPEPECPPQA